MPPNLRAFATIACCCAALTFAPPLLASAAERTESQTAAWTFDDLRPTITSADGRFSLSLRARLQIDNGGFDQSDDVTDVTPERDVEFKDLNSGALVRRAYLGIEGRAFRDFWYEFRLDFGGDGFRIADPYVHLARISYTLGNYDAGPLLRLNAGLIKPIFTYNDPTSSASLTFIERAAVANVATSAFGAGASRLGAELTFQQNNLLRPGDNLVVSGAFTGHVASVRESGVPEDSTSDGTHALGRIVYRLWSDGLSNVQVGASFSRLLSVGGGADANGARTQYLQDRPEIRVDGNSLVGTGPLPTTGGALRAFEAAANLRNFYVAGEYHAFGIDRYTDCPGCIVAANPGFSGWYVEGSWILTGETKTYQANAMNNGMATFANPHVAAPFAFDGRNWGAWEIAARYSELDLNWHSGPAGTACTGAFAGCVRGGRQQVWTVGLNWYLNDNLRMLLDYMIVDVDKLDGIGKQTGQTFRVVGARFQITN